VSVIGRAACWVRVLVTSMTASARLAQVHFGHVSGAFRVRFGQLGGAGTSQRWC
jgi:hypothetical protein